jgi:polyisoprenoid-binding protein YceI
MSSKPEVLVMRQPESSSTGRVELPAAGRYRLDPGRSAVTFRTRHLFGLATVSGSMRVITGEVTLDPAIPQASVAATLSASSFSTGNRARDRDVRSARFLAAERYPDITFTAGTLSRAQGRWALAGELMIRQASKQVTLAIESVETDGAGFRARAATRIDRYAFGLTAAKGMAARHLDIELTAAAERA